MPSPLSPETGGAYIYDASTFLKGLRSISLRNLSFRCDNCTASRLMLLSVQCQSSRLLYVFAYTSTPVPHCIPLYISL